MIIKFTKIQSINKNIYIKTTNEKSNKGKNIKKKKKKETFEQIGES